MIDGELVALIHQTVLADEAGLKGRADMARLDGALSRIANWRQYENLRTSTKSPPSMHKP